MGTTISSPIYFNRFLTVDVPGLEVGLVATMKVAEPARGPNLESKVCFLKNISGY